MLLGVFILAGCMMRKSAMWIEPDATRDNLTFGVAKQRGGTRPVDHMNSIVVQTCYTTTQPQDVFWRAGGAVPNGQSVPTRIKYGELPLGFSNVTPPRSLVPGCYEASIRGEGVANTAKFMVHPDGRVEEVRANAE